MTVIAKPVGRGRWGAWRTLSVQSVTPLDLFALQVGQQFDLFGRRYRITRIEP